MNINYTIKNEAYVSVVISVRPVTQSCLLGLVT